MGSGACVRMIFGGGNRWIVENDRRIFRRTSAWISVYIDGIVEDKGKVSGLCGNYNGERDDDYRSPDDEPVSCPSNVCPQFSNLWKVPDEDNLFNTLITEVEVNYDLPTLCQCKKEGTDQEIVCEPPTTQNRGN